MPHPDIDTLFSMQTVLPFAGINRFIFQRPPEPFDKDLLQPATSAIHRYLDVSIYQDVRYGYACGRASLRVPDLTGIFGSSLRSLMHKSG